jgi:tRNA (cytidine/uridine-2'-O-)-methyltransferase
LYQPDIPQNLGAAIRLAACFAAPLDVIEPCGFALTDRALKRAALDYGRLAEVVRHASFADFLTARPGRLVLIETDADTPLHEFAFLPGDCLILGRESAGSPAELRAAAAGVGVRIPMAAGGALAQCGRRRRHSAGRGAEADRGHGGAGQD